MIEHWIMSELNKFLKVLTMIVLGYSGLDNSFDYNKRNNSLLPGEERIIQGFDSAAAILKNGEVIADISTANTIDA